MKRYNRKTHFENKKCIDELVQFKQIVKDYLDNRDVTTDDMLTRPPIECEQRMIKKATTKIDPNAVRTTINEKLPLIRQIMIDAGINHSSARDIPGSTKTQYIDVLDNIFELSNLYIPYSHVVDPIERAIGVYKNDSKSSMIRTYNPFFWIKELLDFVVGIPFYFLQKSGFNNNLENTFVAKVIKFATYIISSISGAWFIMDKLGLNS